MALIVEVLRNMRADDCVKIDPELRKQKCVPPFT